MTAPDRKIWTRAAEPSGRGRPDHCDQEVHDGGPTVWEKRRNAVGARAGAGPGLADAGAGRDRASALYAVAFGGYVAFSISHLRPAHQEGGAARMAQVAREIARMLEPHTQVEEHGLFPALAADFPDQIAALEAEHRRVEAVLAEAADGVTPADPTWPDRLIEATAMLRDHILKEQDGVFPAALANLSTEDWEAVEATRAKGGSTLSRPTARVKNPAGRYS
ncbi:hemerythrin domain-containing protein [Streptomyces sp. NPDC007856]|uniref:hemerythrin domain-containing protein n=1 Tax=Streptomyces sp. NPDC007856 TaxID=3364781 RepID=UPI00369F0614